MRARPSGSFERGVRWWGPPTWCVLLVLALVGGRTARAEEEKGAKKAAKPRASLAWRDRAVLTQRLTEACDAVERVCGATYNKRPTLRVSDAETIAKIMEAEFRETKAFANLDHAALAKQFAPFLLGKYDPATGVIHVLPKSAERMVEFQGETVGPDEDVLRVLLVHEATHALDWQRFELETTFFARTTIDGALAVNAVSEGHAQWVAELVAAEWRLTPAFERLTRWIVTPPANLSQAEAEAVAPVVAQATFAYVHGLTFMQAVAKAKGRDGMDEALSDPPRSTRDIEEPQRWLSGQASPPTPERDPDLNAVLADLRVLVGDPSWTVNTNRLLAAVLRTQAGKIVPEDRARFLEGYEDGQVLAAQVPGEDVMVLGMALLFREPAQASLFAGMERRSTLALKGEVAPGMEIVSTDMAEGAGPGGKLEGFAMRRELRTSGTILLVQTQVAAIGRVVIELVVAGVPAFDRAVQDSVLARAALRLTDPEAAAKAPALESPEYRRTSRRALTVRIVGPDGAPVPHVRLSAESEKGTGVNDVAVEGGTKELLLERHPNFRISVWGAADTEGKPLPLAPRSLVAVEEDAKEIEIRLEPGVEILGKVVDADGKAVAGVTVEALATHASGNHTIYTNDVYASGVTGADGAFRLTGLEGSEYRLRLVRLGKAASVGETRTRGGARDVVVVVRPPRSFRITVEDADGKPVRDARVEVQQRGEGSWASGSATSDATGVATVSDLEPDREGSLEVTPPPNRGDVGMLYRSSWNAGDEVVRLPNGYVIRGRVVDAEGKIVSARVWHRTRRGSRRASYTNSDGTFAILHVPLGPARIAAVPMEEREPGSPAPEGQLLAWTLVRPDAPEVQLVIQASPPEDTDEEDAGEPGSQPPVSVTLRVPDARVARMGAMNRVGDDPRPGVTFRIAADGSVEIKHLVPGRYEVWIPTVEGDDRCAYVPDLEIGATALEIALVPAITQRIRLVLPADTVVEGVEVLGPLGARFKTARGSDGVYEVRGVPPGKWKGRVRARTARAWLEADVEAADGKELEVAPQPTER